MAYRSRPQLWIVHMPAIGLIYSELATRYPLYSNTVQQIFMFLTIFWCFFYVKYDPVLFVSPEECFLVGFIFPRPYHMYQVHCEVWVKDIQRDDGNFEN